MKDEPARLEMFLTRLAFIFCGKSVYKAFADRLPLHGGERMLDFGCGMGTVAYYVAKKLTDGHLTCLDVSRRRLKACRRTLRRFENVAFYQSGREIPPLEESSFDVVYCHFVLHDIAPSSLDGVIAALVKSLQSGGLLVFREPLNESQTLSVVKHLAGQNELILKDSRITDVPLMGNALESIYTKTTVSRIGSYER